jgi:starch-binding outer membrane protein, SusD/RagB family
MPFGPPDGRCGRAAHTNELRHRSLQALLLIGAMASGLTACSDLTRVSDPTVTQPSNLADSAGAFALRAGAVQLFANAFGSQVEVSGLLADEFTTDGSSSTDQRVVPSSDVAPSEDPFPFDVLSQARVNGLLAAQALERYSPRTPGVAAELFAYVGYVDLLFAEDMCSGVPVGIVANSSVSYGPTETREQLLNEALAYFDSATTYGGDSSALLMLAAVGKARALLDSGDFAGAAAIAAGVPPSYVYFPPYDGVHQYNTVVANIVYFQHISVSDDEGINGLPFVSGADPRVPTAVAGAFPSGAPIYAFSTYSSLATPIPLASGLEAGLIGAEAALEGGNATTWANELNTLRQNAIAPAMDPLPADSTTGATTLVQQDVMFRERAFWLFATGHRQSDLRRLVRQYGRSQNAVFPTGVYAGGPAQYGTDVTFVPFGEQTNPNYSGCIDRNP